MSSAIPTVRATALSSGEDDSYALAFELHNAATEDTDLWYYEPFTDFEILATTPEEQLEVYQPELDIPVRRTSLTVPGGGKATLRTPIRLQIEEGAGGGSDGFIWTVKRRGEVLPLGVRLGLPPPFDVTSTLVFV